MTAQTFDSALPSDRAPLLRWMIFTGVCAFGFVLLWHYGLFRVMLNADRTNLSLIITLLYAATTLHCLWRTSVISRELDAAQRVAAIVEHAPGKVTIAGANVIAADGARLPAGCVTRHIRSLALKSGLQGRHRLDQTLLLRSLADQLRGPNQIGSFASDSLMKLGLLGTIIGFIMMLAPIAGLDAGDRASVKTSMGLMSDGMAVAMYTTLTGLIGSILIKIQYYMLDAATARLFSLASDVTEVFVVSSLERENG